MQEAHFLRRRRGQYAEPGPTQELPGGSEAHSDSRPGSSRPRRSLRLAVLGTVIGLLAGLTFLAAALTLRKDEPQKSPNALPAAITNSVKPKPGRPASARVYAAASPAVVSVAHGNGSGTAS